MKNQKHVQTSNEISELWPGQSIELLKSLHVLTREGKLNQDSRRKLKQIQHLVQLIKPFLNDAKSVADLGAGKSYLGFMLYDLILSGRNDSRLFAVEQRPELITRCREIASSAKFDRIDFVADSILGSLNSTHLPSQLDVVTALHACDTATDEAIAFALSKHAKFIALVPCCQAEVARLLDGAPVSTRPNERSSAGLPTPVESSAALTSTSVNASASSGSLGGLKALWGHGIHRREFGSHLTNVVRALFLESRGYKVRVTELVGWEHSMKNEIILAEKVQRGNRQAQLELDRLLAQFPHANGMKLFSLVPAPTATSEESK